MQQHVPVQPVQGHFLHGELKGPATHRTRGSVGQEALHRKAFRSARAQSLAVKDGDTHPSAGGRGFGSLLRVRNEVSVVPVTMPSGIQDVLVSLVAPGGRCSGRGWAANESEPFALQQTSGHLSRHPRPPMLEMDGFLPHPSFHSLGTRWYVRMKGNLGPVCQSPMDDS